MMHVTFTSRFARGDKVVADRAYELVMTVTAHEFRQDHIVLECCYIANSEFKKVWVEEWRLEHTT